MDAFIKTTEEPSPYRHLENKPVSAIISGINNEDKKVADVVEQALPQIEQLIKAAYKKLSNGGRLFYIGAGTSGRLGILDASECPPTFGVSYDLVQGIIAGGYKAITRAVENAEDDTEQGWKDLQENDISDLDFVIGIAASGTTPYVISALERCNENNIETGCITCNDNSPLASVAKYPIEAVTGAEFLTGSTRMKSGTAQKMILNMISTTLMILMGRVEDNRMVNMMLTNTKLVDRGVKMVMAKTGISQYETAKDLLLKNKSVKLAVAAFRKKSS